MWIYWNVPFQLREEKKMNKRNERMNEGNEIVTDFLFICTQYIIDTINKRN